MTPTDREVAEEASAGAIEDSIKIAALLKRAEAAEAERDAWKETAAHFSHNSDYYQGIVVDVGKLLGDAVYTQDDGKQVPDVLCAKVYEVAAEAIAERDRLRIKVDDHSVDLAMEYEKGVQTGIKLDNEETVALRAELKGLRDFRQMYGEAMVNVATLRARVADRGESMNIQSEGESVSEDTVITEVAVQENDRIAADLLNALLQEIRLMPKPWEQIGEDEQGETIDRLRKRVCESVRDAVYAISSDQRVTVRATVESVTFKDGIKVVVTMGKHMEGRHDIADATGQDVLMVLADPSAYMVGVHDIKPDPDQNELNLEAAAGRAIDDAKGDK